MRKEWEQKNIHSDWLGFEYIDELKNIVKNNEVKCNNPNNPNNPNNTNNTNNPNNPNDPNNAMICLLYPLYFNKPNLKSIQEFNNLMNNIEQ